MSFSTESVPQPFWVEIPELLLVPALQGAFYLPGLLPSLPPKRNSFI